VRPCASIVEDGGEDLEVRRIDIDRLHRVVIRLRGPLILRTASSLREVLLRLEDGDVGSVVTDLSAVSHIDAAGIGVLLASRARLRWRGRLLTAIAPQAPVRAALQITGANDLIGGHE
jgi:anti-anti-sigma factor